MRASFYTQADGAFVYADEFNFATLFAQLRAHFVDCFDYAGFQIFGMEAVENEYAADQGIATKAVDDGHSLLSCIGDDVESFLDGRTMQIHQRLHQGFRYRPDGGIST